MSSEKQNHCNMIINEQFFWAAVKKQNKNRLQIAQELFPELFNKHQRYQPTDYNNAATDSLKRLLSMQQYPSKKKDIQRAETILKTKLT